MSIRKPYRKHPSAWPKSARLELPRGIDSCDRRDGQRRGRQAAHAPGSWNLVRTTAPSSARAGAQNSGSDTYAALQRKGNPSAAAGVPSSLPRLVPTADATSMSSACATAVFDLRATAADAELFLREFWWTPAHWGRRRRGASRREFVRSAAACALGARHYPHRDHRIRRLPGQGANGGGSGHENCMGHGQVQWITLRCATYPANLCPFRCGGAASRSRPRRTILPNESGNSKRFRDNRLPASGTPAKWGFSGTLR